ncbi:IQ motif and ankyrin repeat domain-containing protein 1-like [Babylonia areolata]|uniref:IQ motif and ankyrin repeat domain-containing protein 1-like n=1 Tax=Babylonia areolata TaxID=304850 RepID=UPI003FD295D8
MPPKPAPKVASKGHPAKHAAKHTPKPAAGKTPVAKKASGTSVPGAKKAGAAAAKGNKAGGDDAKKAAAAPKEHVWGPQDDAARTIQTNYRRLLAKKELAKRREKKLEYDALMDKLEKDAFVHLVKLQQEEAARQQQKEDEERKRKAEERKRKKRMLDAAFDGDTDDMRQILKEVTELDDKNGVGDDVIGRALRNRHQLAMVNCEDANENTPISEAASGGHVDSILFLLERGADPNSVGQFRRTPLYRAAFAGHMEAVQVLLQNGADPRVYASDGQTPEHVASVEAIAQLLSEWDISQTEMLLKKLEQATEQRKEEERKRKEAETSKLEDQVHEAEKEYETMQKKLNRSYQELEKRIREHDKASAEGFERTDITLQTIHDAEADLEVTKIDVEKARDKLAKIRLLLREKTTGEAGEIGEDRPGQKVLIRELDDVLFRDVGNKIKDSGKWPLIIDPSGQASTFLRYRDTNYINAIRPSDMEDQRARMAILGALRFGKPLVLDMMEVDMFQTISDCFDHIMPGLLPAIMDMSILQNQKYLGLLKPNDPPEYDKNKFNDLRLSNFKFFIVSKNPYPREELLDQTYPIQVFLPDM